MVPRAGKGVISEERLPEIYIKTVEMGAGAKRCMMFMKYAKIFRY